MKQPWAWITWLITAVVMLSVTRNPLYLVIILLCILLVSLSIRRASAESVHSFYTWQFGLWILFIAAGFNALTSHFGETILFTIPGHLPLISGNITLEAVVYGATNGLILTGILAGFSVLNMALPVRELISLIPRAFFPLAMVTSIAVTYLPTTQRQFRQIREAQAVRGHQMRSLRDWLPLIMPLLVGGLEHAMQLAEAMTARGFASHNPLAAKPQLVSRLMMLAGIIALAAGWVIQLASAGWAGWLLIVLGGGVILSGLWILGRQSQRTVYHRHTWSWQDGLMMAVSAVILASGWLPLPGLSQQTLYYDPYPLLSLPAFSPLLGLLMLGFIVPGLLVLSARPGIQQ